MRNIKLVFQYDGTFYSGWQVQPDKRTVQGVLTEKLSLILNERVAVYASSRTDSGAHALGQVVNFKTSSGITPGRLKTALNGLLPEDIAVIEAGPVPEDFHACYSAKKRLYRYKIRNASCRSPFDRLYTYHFPCPLDASRMRRAAGYIKGTRDFSAFKSSRGEKQNRVRTVSLLEITRESGHISIDVQADGFLTYMVRNIAGTLLETGRGRMEAEQVKSIVNSGDRKKAGPTLPARGLCLIKVEY